MQMTKASGAYFLMPAPTCSMTLRLIAKQIVAAHAGLARHAGGDDADLGAVERFVGIGADQVGVEAVDRRRLRDIERLALRHALGDVEQHDVAEFLRGQSRCASVPPICPEPIRAILSRAMGNQSFELVQEGGKE